MEKKLEGIALILFGILVGLVGGVAWYIGLICGIIGLWKALLN